MVVCLLVFTGLELNPTVPWQWPKALQTMLLEWFFCLFEWLQTAFATFSSHPARSAEGYNSQLPPVPTGPGGEIPRAHLHGINAMNLLKTFPPLDVIEKVIPRLKLSTIGLLGVLSEIPNPSLGSFVSDMPYLLVSNNQDLYDTAPRPFYGAGCR